jgi:hypothetical protein
LSCLVDEWLIASQGDALACALAAWPSRHPQLCREVQEVTGTTSATQASEFTIPFDKHPEAL